MLKFNIGTEERMHLESCGPADELAAEVLTLIAAIYGEMSRADASVATGFRMHLLAGMLPFSPVWRDPPEGEGVSMVVPMPGKEKGRSNAE